MGGGAGAPQNFANVSNLGKAIFGQIQAIFGQRQNSGRLWAGFLARPLTSPDQAWIRDFGKMGKKCVCVPPPPPRLNEQAPYAYGNTDTCRPS